MIVFQLICEEGHEFEGWFNGHDAFLARLQEGLIHCPTCGSSRVSQRLATGGKLRSLQEMGPEGNVRAFARTLQRLIEAHFEDVGQEFAKTALKMHYGVEEERNIRGTTTEAEEQMLWEEEVEFFKIPLPDTPGDSDMN